MRVLRILIVDDNADSAESLAILFGLDGHVVTTVADGEAALTAAGPFQADVIVVDIGLPGIDGYEVARRLRQSGCSARIIALTGFGQFEDILRARAAGFDHHCLKPVEPLSLNHLLH